jgi:hypothetical protein
VREGWGSPGAGGVTNHGCLIDDAHSNSVIRML